MYHAISSLIDTLITTPNIFAVTVSIIKITISSIVIGLKKSYFPLACQVVIGQFVIGQFNKPITFKVVV